MQYENIFPSVLWKSLFLSTYFLMENSLDQIYNNLKKSNSFTLSLKDISGNGIFRSSLYLKKVCNVLKPFQSETWTEITNINKIRNVFGIAQSLTHINLMQFGGIAGFICTIWAMGQFFGKGKIGNYVKAFLAFFLGMLTFAFAAILSGVLFDLVFKH